MHKICISCTNGIFYRNILHSFLFYYSNISWMKTSGPNFSVFIYLHFIQNVYRRFHKYINSLMNKLLNNLQLKP